MGGFLGWDMAPGYDYLSVLEQVAFVLETVGFRIVGNSTLLDGTILHGVCPGSHSLTAQNAKVNDIAELTFVHKDWTPLGWLA